MLQPEYWIWLYCYYCYSSVDIDTEAAAGSRQHQSCRGRQQNRIEWSEREQKALTQTHTESEMMENGYDGKFAEKFSGLAISGAADPPNRFPNNNTTATANDSSLFQVMKAVEAAEATIKQQVDENIRLRTELQNKILELDRYVSPTDFPFLFSYSS